MSAFAGDLAERFALLLGLSLFFGFAFEEFYSDELPRRPGGVRTFPLLALAGGGLYLLEPAYGAAFIAGLVVVGSWIYAYVRRESKSAANAVEGAFVVPACNLLAYTLGAIALTQPLWLAVGVAVAAVLLLGGRRTLHDWAARVSTREVVTAGQFLILVGVVLPLLAGRPPIPYTTITPFGVWLAVVAVSSISYASYLLQRYAFPNGGTLLTSVLGGLYSSTAATAVLARRMRDEGASPELEAGIVAATAMMYVRILVVCSIFNLNLGRMLVLPLLVLAAIGGGLAYWRFHSSKRSEHANDFPNPLQLWTAFIFALLFVAVSMLSSVAQSRFGSSGVFALAGIVGVTDIDPFVLSLAQGGAVGIGPATAAAAIVIAASSNNVLKAVYSLLFSRGRAGGSAAVMLCALAALGVAYALVLVR
ncbi:MAG TPA: DUF4010 domain-containing protein [Candidatus Cybelea sp.]|jgi:uncharacterized membrane protein (DUF4010 family)|nr:DUF4010 domain-containing protein [Candidatus Cybelea sp.]